MPKKRRSRLWLLIGLPLVLLVVAGGLLAAFFAFMPDEWPEARPFDQRIWKAAKNWDSDSPRASMVDSLLADDRLRGMTRAQVIALLGPPDGVDDYTPDSMRVSQQELAGAEEFQYVLGMWSGFRMDYDCLAVRFGRGGRVVGWNVWQG